MEAAKTTVIGTDNTLDVAIEETKAKITSLEYIQNDLSVVPIIVKYDMIIDTKVFDCPSYRRRSQEPRTLFWIDYLKSKI